MNQAGELPGGRVAMLFTDVQGSTALLHQLGNAYGDVLDEHDRILRGVWEEFGGVEVDNEGDAFFVAFADHARAIEAATAAQQRLAAGAWPDGVQLKVRMGLHSGEPAIRGRKYWGVDVHYAARLGSAANGGQVLVSADMRAQVPHADVEMVGTHGLKDFPAGRQLFHLVVDGSTARDFPPPRTLTAVRSNLPTIDTPIIGREDVLADLRRRLTGPDHLVTLVAPGGMGKTRTAIAIGNELAEEFPDGVAFVAMASFADVDAVVPGIAEAMQEDLQGVDQEAALLALLRERKLLVILDNAEHLPDLSAMVARLVSASAETRWLVTSQAPLDIRAEARVRLDALEVPVGDDTDIEFVPSVALFLDRARARQPGFTVGPDDQRLLATLCQELEGMPLALELAAARAPTLGLARLVQALSVDPDRALGQGSADLPDRQRGLQAALDWTASLLTELEHEVYVAGGAFAEAWSIDDLEYMLEGRADAVQVWDALARLLDLALVVQRGDGRFTMPERVRRHATRVLKSIDDDHRIRRRHAELVLETVGRLAQHEKHVHFRSAMASIEDRLPEVQHALTWASAHDSDAYRMLLGSTGWPLGWFDKHHAWLDDLVRFARSEDPGDLAQGRVWGFAATNMSGVDDLAQRRTWLDAALARFLELEDHRWVCEMYVTLWEFETHAGNGSAGLEALDTGHEYAASHGLAEYARSIDDCRAIALIAAGDYEEAERRIRPWLDNPGETTWASAGVTTYLGDCAFGQGHYVEAVGWYAQDLRGLPRSEMGNVLMQVVSMAASCAALGLDEVAVELSTAGRGVAQEFRVNLENVIRAGGLDEHLEAAAQRLPLDEAEAARARGQQLDYDALIERALEIAAEVTTEATA